MVGQGARELFLYSIKSRCSFEHVPDGAAASARRVALSHTTVRGGRIKVHPYGPRHHLALSVERREWGAGIQSNGSMAVRSSVARSVVAAGVVLSYCLSKADAFCPNLSLRNSAGLSRADRCQVCPCASFDT